MVRMPQLMSQLTATFPVSQREGREAKEKKKLMLMEKAVMETTLERGE